MTKVSGRLRVTICTIGQSTYLAQRDRPVAVLIDIGVQGGELLHLKLETQDR